MTQSVSLSSDIQRALQQAIGEANNAFSVSHSEKKKKKRRLSNDSEANAGVKEKKRKGSGDAQAQEDLPTSSTEPISEHKKSKKKKHSGKGKERAVDDVGQEAQESEQRDASTIDGHQASSAAFLSAVLAAASATSDSQTVESASYDPNLQPQPVVPDGQQVPPYMMYPQLPCPYPDPNASYTSSAAHPQNLFPSLGLPIPDFHMASHDDILRVLQEVDVSKIANVLKTLGDAAAAANIPMNALHPYIAPARPGSSQMGLPPGNPAAILSTAAANLSKPSHKRVLNMSLPGPEQTANPDHAHMLANKWMNASKLAELVKTEGLVYKKGKFSAIEEQQVKAAIENYRDSRGMNDEQILEIIFQKNEKMKDNVFWSEITSSVPQRPIIAVYHYVRRAYHPKKHQGKWSTEEDSLLNQAVMNLGQQWEKVSEVVGRMSSDCRDRYRNHIAHRDIRVSGPWTKEEEDELTKIVTEMTVRQGKDIDNDVFWGVVSEKMGNKRGRQQCRIKWTDALSKTVKNEGQRPRWSPKDAYILVHKVDSLNVRDDTEIDWKTLSDADWNLWSAHSLQRRWLTMKRGIKGFEDMTHQEIMDILRVKKAHLPPSSVSSRKRKVTSAPNVDDGDTNGGDQTSVAGGSEAGPSSSRRGDGGDHGDSSSDLD